MFSKEFFKIPISQNTCKQRLICFIIVTILSKTFIKNNVVGLLDPLDRSRMHVQGQKNKSSQIRHKQT